MGQFLSGSLQNQRGQQQQGRQHHQRGGPHQGNAVAAGICITKAMNTEQTTGGPQALFNNLSL